MTPQNKKTTLIVYSKNKPPQFLATSPDLCEVRYKAEFGNSILQVADVEIIYGDLKPGEHVVVECFSEREVILGSAYDFPKTWTNWVYDYEVQVSAINHICRHNHSVWNLVSNAVQPGTLEERFDNWLGIAKCVLRTEAVTQLSQRTLGTGGRLKPSQVQAMPIRIAQRLSKWYPPKPRPLWTPQTAQPPLVPLSVVEVLK